MPGPTRSLRRRMLVEQKRRHERSPVGPAQDAAEQVHERPEAIALVAAAFDVAAQRQHRPAGRQRRRIGRRLAVRVHDPAVRQRLARPASRPGSCRRPRHWWQSRSRSAAPCRRPGMPRRSDWCRASARPRPAARRPGPRWSSTSRSVRARPPPRRNTRRCRNASNSGPSPSRCRPRAPFRWQSRWPVGRRPAPGRCRRRRAAVLGVSRRTVNRRHAAAPGRRRADRNRL